MILPRLHPNQLDLNQGTEPELPAKHSIFGLTRLLVSTLAIAQLT
jgi:hypothetical protein